jgi:murein DD-endopeptidase MepM/ murein hydrolase activator NlpD
MKSEKIHIIITGESGEGRTFVVDRRLLGRCLFTGLSLLAFLLAGTISGCYHWQEKSALEKKLSEVSTQKEMEQNQLIDELAESRKELRRIRLQKLRVIDQYETKLARLRQETEKIYSGDIHKRARLIKALMDEVGIRFDFEEDPSHSGGLYLAPPDNIREGSILDEADRFVLLLRQLPLGRPVDGKISSLYGRRRDPLNHKKAFHAGLDFRGRRGDKIHVTGSGVIKRSGYQRGFGNCIVVDHGNGYETLYAHLSKRLVKKGEQVYRDQVIGLMGSTGRSTGTHLHYEVHYRNKTVNPIKFLRIARLLASKK